MDELMRRRIEQLNVDTEAYRQAIKDAEDALDAAEKELTEALSELQDNDG